MLYLGTEKPKEIYVGSRKVKEIYRGGVRVYPNGNEVTYIWNGNQTVELVDFGADCLNPNFTPKRDDAIFKGWSKSVGSATPLKDLAMGDEPITLYAIFTYPDATLQSGTKEYEFKNKTVTLCTVDNVKYSSVDVTAQIYDLGCAAWSTSCSADAYINGVWVRNPYYNSNDGHQEVGNLPGAGGKSFTLTINISGTTGKTNINAWTTGDVTSAHIRITKITGKGRTIVG